MLLITACLSFGATRYVRPGATGTSTGLDWANAYPSIPSTLVRGDTYYLSTGSYGTYTFDDANSGSTKITVRKATLSDHGTDTGWQSAFGTGQAQFTHWNFFTDYYEIDGVTRNPDWQLGAVNQYGIVVSGNQPVRLDNGGGQGGDYLTFKHVDIRGGGRDTGSGDDVIYGLTGNSNITFQNCALHDSDRTIFLMRGNWQNLLVDHCYIARNTSTPAIHGELLSMTQSTNVTWSNNVMEDIEGTAFIAGLNNGTISNWRIYGNVAFHSAAYRANTGRKSGHNFGVSGFIFIANDASNRNIGNNFLVYNNTFYNLTGTYSGVVIQSGSGNIIANNIWYNCVRTANSGGAFSYNWYYATTKDGDSSSTSITCTSDCAILTNPAAKDFRLTKATPPGLTLGATFSVDPKGDVRGADAVWDRGAYEFTGSPTSVLLPPSGVTADGKVRLTEIVLSK